VIDRNSDFRFQISDFRSAGRFPGATACVAVFVLSVCVWGCFRSPSLADERPTEAAVPVATTEPSVTESAKTEDAAAGENELNSFLDDITPAYEEPPQPEPDPPPTGGESGADLLVPTFRDDGVEVMPSLGDFVKEEDDPKPEPELDVAQLRAADARQMLEYYGIDESQLSRLVDGVPMEEGNETLIKILYRMPQISSMQMLGWTRDDISFDELIADPTEFRAEVLPLRGRVKFIDPVDLAAKYPEMAQRWEFAKYYRVTFELDDSPYPVLIFVRRFGLNSEFAPLPDRWVKAAAEGAPLDERASCQGMFLKLGGDSAGYLREGETADGEDDQPRLLFAAQRVAWHPDNRNGAEQVSDDLVLLGDAGMDVGLLDTVRMGGPLETQDREAFYQMLDAMRVIEEKDVKRPPIDNRFEAMMEDPRGLQGKFVTMKGVAHRATRLRVKDPDIAKRLGIDHYYEVYVFVALDQSIVFTKSKDSREGLRYTNAYPIVFCVRSLPPGMEEGENIHERVKISGFFFKLYEYRTAYAAQQNEDTKQRSPMIIGLAPELIPDEEGAGGYAQVILGVCFVVALVAIWLLIWFFGRGDKKFNESSIAGRYQVADGKSLNEMGIEASDGPDFSGLSEARDDE
jgi:hypothetical protein